MIKRFLNRKRFPAMWYLLIKYIHLAHFVDMKKIAPKHNVLQEEDRGIGKCMINRSLRPVMNLITTVGNLT